MEMEMRGGGGMEMERGVGLQGRAPGSAEAPGSAVPARQRSRTTRRASPGGEALTRDLPPPLLAQPCSTGETLAGGWCLASGTSKGRAAPAALLVALEKQIFSIKHPPHLRKYTKSRAGENEASLASHPSRVQVAQSAQPYKQSHPLPQQMLLSCTHPAPSMPLICNKSKSSL